MRSCESCGRPLSFLRRARGETQCPQCAADGVGSQRQPSNETVQAVADTYRAKFEILDGSPAAIVQALPRLRALKPPAGLSPQTAETIRGEAFEALGRKLEGPDGRLDLWASELLDGLWAAMQLPKSADFPAVRSHLLRMARSDILPPLPWPTDAAFLRLADEIMHWGSQATLLKIAEDRELRLDIHGTQRRLTDRWSMTAGQATGREVEVGSHLQAVDHGMAYVTSARFVFTSAAAALDLRWEDLLSIDSSNDELLIHTRGEQQHPLTSEQADLLAAFSQAAVRHSRGTKPTDGPYPELPPLDATKEETIAREVARNNWPPATANFFRLRDALDTLDWDRLRH
jgi:hypothetical protein